MRSTGKDPGGTRFPFLCRAPPSLLSDRIYVAERGGETIRLTVTVARCPCIVIFILYSPFFLTLFQIFMTPVAVKVERGF